MSQFGEYSKEKIRELAKKHNMKINQVEAILLSQFEFAKKVIMEDDFGCFHFSGAFKIKPNSTRTRKIWKDVYDIDIPKYYSSQKISKEDEVSRQSIEKTRVLQGRDPRIKPA